MTENSRRESIQGQPLLSIADKLALVQRDLDMYAAIIDAVYGEMRGPERCRIALRNIREGLDRSNLALSLIAFAEAKK